MQLTKQRKMKIKEIAESVYRTPSLISRYFNGKCNVSAEVENGTPYRNLKNQHGNLKTWSFQWVVLSANRGSLR